MQKSRKPKLWNMENIEEITDPIIQALENIGTNQTSKILENKKIAEEIVSHVQARYLGRNRNVLCLDETAKTKITDEKLQEIVERYVKVSTNAIKLSPEMQSLPHNGNKQVDINTQKRISIKEGKIKEETIEMQRECFDITRIETCQLKNRMALKRYIQIMDEKGNLLEKKEKTYRIVAIPEQGIDINGSTVLSTKPFKEYPKDKISLDEIRIIKQAEGIRTKVYIKNTENGQEFSEQQDNKMRIEDATIEDVKSAALQREYEKSQKAQSMDKDKVVE